MFDNKKDPLLNEVTNIMNKSKIAYEIEKTLCEELGIVSKKALPFEYHSLYENTLEERVNEALHPNQQKLDVHEPHKNKLTAQDFAKLRSMSKKKPIKEEEHLDEVLDSSLSKLVYMTKASIDKSKTKKDLRDRLSGKSKLGKDDVKNAMNTLSKRNKGQMMIARKLGIDPKKMDEETRLDESPVKRIIKKIKRISQGWPINAKTPSNPEWSIKQQPKDIIDRTRKFSTDDLRKFAKDSPKSHSPAGLQTSVAKQELKRRGKTNEETQLDEISAEKLGRYIKKASANKETATNDYNDGVRTLDINHPKQKSDHKKIKKRTDGIRRATNRLVRHPNPDLRYAWLKHGTHSYGLEEQKTNLDEISAEKLGRYIKLASKNRETARDDARAAAPNFDYNDPRRVAIRNKISKRAGGIRLAANKLAGDTDVDLNSTRRTRVSANEETQLDELSKGTLGRYIKKAKSDLAKHSLRRGWEKAKADEYIDPVGFKPGKSSEKDQVKYYGHRDSADHYETKSDKRRAGIDKAVDRLTKEETQLDELSKKTLGSYIKKAQNDMHSRAAITNSDFEANDFVRHHRKKSDNRSVGIDKAADKLTKEETQLDELSKKKISDYISKNFKDIHNYHDDTEENNRKVHNRSKGLERALDKRDGNSKKKVLTKESQLDEKCWKGYEMFGTKNKNGKKVPNCVPVEESGDVDYNTKDTKKTFPNVKHFTKDGNPDWAKHGLTKQDKSIAYATTRKAKNREELREAMKEMRESIIAELRKNLGEDEFGDLTRDNRPGSPMNPDKPNVKPEPPEPTKTAAQTTPPASRNANAGSGAAGLGNMSTTDAGDSPRTAAQTTPVAPVKTEPKSPEGAITPAPGQGGYSTSPGRTASSFNARSQDSTRGLADRQSTPASRNTNAGPGAARLGKMSTTDAGDSPRTAAQTTASSFNARSQDSTRGLADRQSTPAAAKMPEPPAPLKPPTSQDIARQSLRTPVAAARNDGKTGTALAQSGVSRQDRLNQDFVSRTLGPGAPKAGSAQANLALKRHFDGLKNAAGKTGGLNESMEHTIRNMLRKID